MVSVERQYQNDIDEALSERDAATRALDAIRDELMAAGLDVAGDEPADKLAHHVFVLRMGLAEVSDQLDALRSKLNTPHTADFVEAVRIEAAHQRERWGTAHDAGKADADWFWLIGYLAGKAIRPGIDHEKKLHHIITTAAACLNWHAYATGADTSMRPGIKQPKETP